jgi:hypothetical protein
MIGVEMAQIISIVAAPAIPFLRLSLRFAEIALLAGLHIIDFRLFPHFHFDVVDAFELVHAQLIPLRIVELDLAIELLTVHLVVLCLGGRVLYLVLHLLLVHLILFVLSPTPNAETDQTAAAEG